MNFFYSGFNLIIGYSLGIFETLIVTKKLSHIKNSEFKLKELLKFKPSLALNAILEEAIWRGFIQLHLCKLVNDNISLQILMVFMVSILFVLSHHINLKDLFLLELLIFSLLLGFIYYFTGKLEFVIGLHFARNQIILNIKNKINNNLQYK
ncbi:CPBP family intramembrane metalloprotease [Clostridium sp. D2Q-14]|uniref:CPBP family intramembrane glutamic endopeptidase n=1 Tax=Anaeromonas gelatinilytica TaxID=2683194 RepID=UPI00193BF3B8|nr:CPBP family intramembrane glutamic endopeptidase [Anaeromonas gelatinilytica]MBS4535683.1 CPBP family intramembrane metalloprotease [Anaeromonas gelatinilytica]